MIFASVCSGIEAASVAWHALGWRAAFFAEIEPFPCAVLEHHYPDIHNYGDVNRFREWPDAAFDVLVGGTPCQSFSVAGLRKGLADPRGNLALTYLAIADRFRPAWLVWENVPGVLSNNRRLTPLECERLQGFPDNYTAIPYRNKPAADGPRYKALGNSMAVNCMRWIGTRIAMVNTALQQTDQAA